jgi:hypothetical protein
MYRSNTHLTDKSTNALRLNLPSEDLIKISGGLNQWLVNDLVSTVDNIN